MEKKILPRTAALLQNKLRWSGNTSEKINSILQSTAQCVMLRLSTIKILHKMKHPVLTANTSSSRTKHTGNRQASITEFSKRPLTDERRRQITNLLVSFIVKDIRPLSDVSGEGFRDIIHFFEPSYTIPYNAILWNTITQQYSALKASILRTSRQNLTLQRQWWTKYTTHVLELK